jgi:Spy/CpxP family protein refolding chaperone
MRPIATTAAILALTSAPAMAASPSSAQDGYNPSGPQIQSQVQGSSAGLPFTGLDLVPLLAVGATLVAIGVGLHRVLGARG